MHSRGACASLFAIGLASAVRAVQAPHPSSWLLAVQAWMSPDRFGRWLACSGWPREPYRIGLPRLAPRLASAGPRR